MGNFINKEWSQIETPSGDEETKDIFEKIKTKSSKKRSSLSQNNESSKNSTIDNESSPIPSGSKLNFDPRSPSNEIVRTPICLADSEQSKKQLRLVDSKYVPFDLRSPTCEYNRTPIHAISDNKMNDNESNSLDASLNISVTSFSLDSSSLIASDSSMLLQQEPPDGFLSNSSNSLSNETPSKLQKLISSNLPRHILQRKQVAKLNKKKLIKSADKENSEILN